MKICIWPLLKARKKVTGYDEDAQVTYEKHKIFLYKEDFDKFIEGLEDVVGFIKKEQGEATPRAEYVPQNTTVNTMLNEEEIDAEKEDTKRRCETQLFR